jgi:uncharacterized membrane-anchored protein
VLLGAGVLSVVACLSIVCSVLVRWLGGSFGFFLSWSVRRKKIQMCHQMKWLILLKLLIVKYAHLEIKSIS